MREALMTARPYEYRAWVTPAILLLLPAGIFLVFIVVPVIQSIWISFYEWDHSPKTSV